MESKNMVKQTSPPHQGVISGLALVRKMATCVIRETIDNKCIVYYRPGYCLIDVPSVRLAQRCRQQMNYRVLFSQVAVIIF